MRSKREILKRISRIKNDRRLLREPNRTDRNYVYKLLVQFQLSNELKALCWTIDIPAPKLGGSK